MVCNSALILALGAQIASAQAAEVFAELTQHNAAFAGLSYGTIGLSGRLVKEGPDSAVAAD